MKRGVIVIMLIISVISFVKFTSATPQFYFSDDFESYSLGYDTLSGIWIPQYTPRVSVQQDNQGKYLLIDSYSPYQGDQDVHVGFYKNFYPSKRKKVSLSWDFSVVSCNVTWKATEGVTPQGSSGYLYYKDPQNFISVELKTNANLTYCGDGTAQISAFKRVNGVSYSLIPYTTYYFEMNRDYNAKLVLETINYVSYNLSIYLDNSLISSSANVPISEVKPGKFLLENGGTITHFDNVDVLEYK